MTTLRQIREAVSRKLQDSNNTAESVATVNNEINRSVRYYKKMRFWFNEGLEVITLTPDAQVIPNIPDDIISQLQVNGMMLTDAQVKIDLQHIPPDDFYSRDNEQTGRPYFFTYVNGDFLLLPTPDRNDYTLTIRYLRDYADLQNDDDSNDFTVNAEDLIMMRTLKNMQGEDKQSLELAATYGALEKQELNVLTRQTSDLNASGCLTTQPILIQGVY